MRPATHEPDMPGVDRGPAFFVAQAAFPGEPQQCLRLASSSSPIRSMCRRSGTPGFLPSIILHSRDNAEVVPQKGTNQTSARESRGALHRFRAELPPKPIR